MRAPRRARRTAILPMLTVAGLLVLGSCATGEVSGPDTPVTGRIRPEIPLPSTPVGGSTLDPASTEPGGTVPAELGPSDTAVLEAGAPEYCGLFVSVVQRLLSQGGNVEAAARALADENTLLTQLDAAAPLDLLRVTHAFTEAVRNQAADTIDAEQHLSDALAELSREVEGFCPVAP